MFGILADDSDGAFALDDFALFAHRLNRCSYFHRDFLLLLIRL